MTSEESPLQRILKNLGPQTPKDYGSAKAYADEVRKWHIDTYNWLNSQHQHYVSTNQVNDVNVAEEVLNGNNNGLRHRGPAVRRVFQFVIPRNQIGGVITEECELATSSRRLIAEATDFILLMFLKMVLLYVLMDLELIDLDYLENLFSAASDFDTLIKLTRSLFYAELVSKLVSTIFEALFVTYGFRNIPRGSTPGKHLLGLEIVQYQDVSDVNNRPGHVRVVRTPFVFFRHSMIRSFMKNMCINFFFPINIFCYGFSHNRAIYDFFAKTLVIQRRPV
ncbi:unnamed protein product [Bursaphelenchus okinawaensis]|uniref:RDD domain-containing protein n=1 Tax=Bursaphelenchus okinawaensis TaxID=465554 RepID=A0A811JW66_9BILA|nr:unnamed protein product [Bursaphelenchus okinawaensis]CAG9085886.1 unnamed protein product [Bursaphelenchus okinawaensis]